MSQLIWIVPALPLAGFLVLALLGRRLPSRAVAWVGAGSVGLSAVAAFALAAGFAGAPPAGRAFTRVLWEWFSAGALTVRVALRLDALSLAWVLVVTFVGFLIHLYSVEFMRGDPGYARFFAYMNLFVASMLVLVLAEDLLLLYLGWEGVGLCSYLLIGFWYRDPANGRAAMKAFITTRVGDAAFAVGLFVLVARFQTLSIPAIAGEAATTLGAGSAEAALIAALLLAGAVGKSAQVPLQTWLPDAMAGPTPVSALIHAATMVTAGVYLIARMDALFALAPAVRLAVAVIGAVTLLVGGLAALVQHDIKRVLAYSTISQVGYMFLALGVAAVPAAVFHFIVHAFFKALLFLGAGAVIHAMAEDHDMFHMGGLRRRMPYTFWTFVVGAASLAALPLVTAGFYSKDLILYESFVSPAGGAWLWAAGLAGALLTAVYSTRMVTLTFFGEVRKEPERLPGWAMDVPLVTLAVLSVAAGALQTPAYLGGIGALSDFLRASVPALPAAAGVSGLEALLSGIAGALVLGGIGATFYVYEARRGWIEGLAATPWGAPLRGFLFSGLGFDRVYQALIVGPYRWLAAANSADVVDSVVGGIAWVARVSNRGLSLLQTGRVRTYAAGIALGVIALLAAVVFR